MEIEIRFLDFLQGIRTPLGDEIIPLITKLGNAGMIWILLTVILLMIPGMRRSGMLMAAALCIDFVLCNGVLKHLFARTRPCDVNAAVELLIARPVDFSFPSGHTAASFASVSALYFAGEKRLFRFAFVLAVLIAFSRLYLYVHYPTDILGGIVIGVISGYLAGRILNASVFSGK